MSTIKEQLEWQNKLVANHLKILESLQPSINAAQNIAKSIQPAVDIANQINASFEPLRRSLKFPNLQIAQQYGELFNNIANQINEVYSEPINNAIRNIELLQNSCGNFKIDIPELKFTEIADSFNEFVDDIELNSSVNNDLVLEKTKMPKPNSLSWDQKLSMIVSILGFLISLIGLIQSLDNHYQEEYLKVFNKINSNLEQIILLESQK